MGAAVGGESTLLRNCKVFPHTKDAMRAGEGEKGVVGEGGNSHWGNGTQQQQYFDAILRILGVNFSKHPFPARTPSAPSFTPHSPCPCPRSYIAMASTAFCNFNCFWLTLLRIADWLDWARPRGVCRVRDVDDIDITWQQCPSSSSSALPAPAPAPAPPSKSGKSSMAKVLAQLFLGLRFSLRFNCPLEVGTATSQRALSYCCPPPPPILLCPYFCLPSCWRCH